MADIDMEQIQRERLDKLLGGVVRRLKDLTERVNLEAIRGVVNAAEGTHGWSTYVYAVAQVEHELAWGFANLNMSQVINAAADADRARAEKVVPVDRDDTPMTNRKTGAVEALAGVAQAAKGWAEGTHQNQVSMGHRDVKNPDEQEFVLADILNMVDDAARQVGVAPVYGDQA